jgi:hypothetical protein
MPFLESPPEETENAKEEYSAQVKPNFQNCFCGVIESSDGD